jgi:hypothetical protein
MNLVRRLLDDLAGIGATVQPAGEQLLLRAGSTPIPAALVRRVRQAKGDLMAILITGVDAATLVDAEREPRGLVPPRLDMEVAFSNRLVEWLDQHPAASPAGRCAWCGRAETVSAVVLPFGTEPGTHTWLHPECWPAWHQARRDEARHGLGA